MLLGVAVAAFESKIFDNSHYHNENFSVNISVKKVKTFKFVVKKIN